VSRLLSSDAVIRNVVVALELAPEPVIVNGDRVQLEQVVLNLLINAMDSAAEAPGGDRTIVVRTQTDGNMAVHVAVQDAGMGLREGLKSGCSSRSSPPSRRNGNGALRVQVDHRGARRGHLGREQPRPGATFHFSLPEPTKRS